jgi:hypothetical protein
MVGCEHIGAAFGQPSDGTERIAVVNVGIARRDQQRAVADHLSNGMPHPFRVARVLDAIGQARGDPQPLFDCRQSNNIPVSEVITPPSKAKCTGSPATCGNSSGIPVRSSIPGANSVAFGSSA